MMTKDSNKPEALQIRSFNVNEEYRHALRTHSYVEFFAKAQSLVNKQPSTSTSPHQKTTMELLLEPDQDLIPSILQNLLPSKHYSLDLKLLILNFFTASADASRILTHLLININQTNANYLFIHTALERFTNYSPEQYKSAVAELDQLTLLSTNPFSDPNSSELKLIRNRYSSVLHRLNSERKRVTKRIKLIKCIKKLSWFRSRLLERLREQLDAAAKGTYILNRDFDTVGRIVDRLREEVEHRREMIRFCLERREDRFPLQEVVKELLRKGGRGFKQQVEELEEQVCLCLVTINRARVLVIKEMSKP